MSRYTKQIRMREPNDAEVWLNNTVTYGFDHVTGYFFEVFQGETKDGEDVLAIAECSTFTGMSNGRIIELMEKYRVDEEHIKGVALDLPI